MDLSFKVYLDGTDDYYIKSAQVVYNPYSFSFDLIFLEGNPKLKDLKFFLIKAFMRDQALQLIKDVSRVELVKNKSRLKLKQSAAITFEAVRSLNSTFILGSYDGHSLAFISVSMTYLDLVLQIAGQPTILQKKFCDIDSQFGLHDYTVTVALRNSKVSFVDEVFRKVFTKETDRDWAYFRLLQSEDNQWGYKADMRFEGKPVYPW